MFLKSLKYLLIAFVNVLLLTILLLLWTDKIELLLNDWVLEIAFLKIVGVTITSLIAMYLLIGYFNARVHLERVSKLKIASLITILISSWLYIGYIVRIYNNQFADGSFRRNLSAKIHFPDRLPGRGIRAEKLSFTEYHMLANKRGFPAIPASATSIDFEYAHEDLLPDYVFTLTYDLPEQEQVATFNKSENRFSRFQAFTFANHKKRVMYEEIRQ